jgi:hypothetical protein
MILGFRGEVDENCTLPWFYEASNGNIYVHGSLHHESIL